MLTEQQCNLLETALTEAVEPRKAAAYLCLHMGLMLAEVAGLRRADVDLDGGKITLCSYVGKPEGASPADRVALLPLDEPRVLPMPPHVRRYLLQHGDLYATGDTFILSGETALPAFYIMQNLLTSINQKYKIADALSASDLRNAFIRRCIQSGMDLYTLCAYIGIRQPNVILKRFREFFTPRMDEVNRLERFSQGYVAKEGLEPDAPKRMNLLILGAGGQGHVVKETAESIGVFDRIAFLDDNRSIAGVIDTLSNLERHVEEYPLAFVAIGNNTLRRTLIERLERAGYIVPVLRHPTATISPTVKAGAGTIFEAKVIVNTAVTIGKGAILASACVIDHGARIKDYVHVDVGAMVKKDSVLEPFTKVPSGSIYSS